MLGDKPNMLGHNLRCQSHTHVRLGSWGVGRALDLAINLGSVAAPLCRFDRHFTSVILSFFFKKLKITSILQVGLIKYLRKRIYRKVLIKM